RVGVGLRGFREPADLADVLQRGGSDLFLGRGRLEVVQALDVPTHATILAFAVVASFETWRPARVARPSTTCSPSRSPDGDGSVSACTGPCCSTAAAAACGP